MCIESVHKDVYILLHKFNTCAGRLGAFCLPCFYYRAQNFQIKAQEVQTNMSSLPITEYQRKSEVIDQCTVYKYTFSIQVCIL